MYCVLSSAAQYIAGMSISSSLYTVQLSYIKVTSQKPGIKKGALKQRKELLHMIFQ